RTRRLGGGSRRLLPRGGDRRRSPALGERHRHEAPRRDARGRSRGQHALGRTRTARAARARAADRRRRPFHGRGAAPPRGGRGPPAPPRRRCVGVSAGAPRAARSGFALPGGGRERAPARAGKAMRTEATARTGQATPLSLRNRVSWSSFGTSAQAGATWLNLVVLARLGGAETVGTLALATAIVAPIFALTNLQLRPIQATDARGRISFSTVLGLRLLTSGLAALGVAVWAGFAARDLGPVVFFVALAHAFESLSDVAHGRLQRAERLDRVARAQAAHGLIGLGLLAGSYALTGSLVWAAAGLALAGLAVFALVDLPS